MASTYDFEESISGIEGDSEEEDEDGIGGTEPLYHARRPMNAFLIFCKRQRAVVKERFPQLENRAVTKILGEWWANLEDSEKSCYTDLAKQYREAFLKANPGFKWYKLPAPPLRPISNRLKLLTGLSSHQGSITPGKLADESQLGGLSSLLVPYNNMSVSPSLAAQCVPKPPKKRYLEENATADDLNQVFDEVQDKVVGVETETVSNYPQNEAVSVKVVEIEPFAKLRNYSVTAKENIAQVQNKSDLKSIMIISNGSVEAPSIGSCLVVKSNNSSFPNNCDRNLSKVKCEEIPLVSDRNQGPDNPDTSSFTAFLNDGIDCTQVKWKTKFEKIKSRHLNYNNNNIDESSDSKCWSSECSLNQDCWTNKLANGKLKEESRNSSIKSEEVSINGRDLHATESFNKADRLGETLDSPAQVETDRVQSVQCVDSSSLASNCEGDNAFYHMNKLPGLKTAKQILNKSVPIISNSPDDNFIRRNKSVRACKGARYQEFMSSNQMGRKRRRKINATNDSRYEGNEEEDFQNHQLLQTGSEEFKPAKEERMYEKMEIESAVYSIHDNLDQSILLLNEIPSTDTTISRSSQARRVKHLKSTKRRKSLTLQKSNLSECPSESTDIDDRRSSSSNFNLEEKIEALPALSLEEFQEKKRAKTKKHSCLEDSTQQEAFSVPRMNGIDRQHLSQTEMTSKFLNCHSHTYLNCCDQPNSDSKTFPLIDTKCLNGSARMGNKCEGTKSLGHQLSAATSNCVSTSRNEKSASLCVSGSTLVGSRKRKARRQKITHLEPGSKKKDTSVVEVDVLNDMGLATLAEVAALSRKESIL